MKRSDTIRMEHTMMDAGLLSVSEVAAKLKLKKSWVYGHANELGAYRLGKYVRFSWPRVIEMLDRRNGSPGKLCRNHVRQEHDKPVDKYE